jgi:hypothetical protein
MTFQISQRGKEYLKTAQTLLRAAQTMSDLAIAAQLKALADDCERRADEASHADAAKASARSAAQTECECRAKPRAGLPRGASPCASRETDAESANLVTPIHDLLESDRHPEEVDCARRLASHDVSDT